MKAWMMALIAGAARILKTAGPYTVNTVFPVPAGVSKIESITGKGAAGTPFYAAQDYYDAYRTTTTVYDGPEWGTDSEVEEYLGRVFDQAAPSDYCNPPAYSASLHRTRTVCYAFTIGDTGEVPATTGASTTAFGRTFPGGVGGPATPVTFTNVPTTGGSAQPFIIPNGGSITSLSYYE